MGKNTIKNSRKKELSKQRNQWYEEKEELELQKNNLGYNQIPLKLFCDENFISQEESKASDQLKKSAIIELHNQLKVLKKKYQLLWPEEAVMSELNEKHAVVHVDQTYILTEKINAFGYKDFSLESPASFRAFYEDEIVVCENGKERSKAIIWLKRHTGTKRRKYFGITFDPISKGHTNGLYNIWMGFALKPQQGPTDMYWDHVRNIICSGNKEHYEYVRKWLSYIFQYPDNVHTALVLCGSQGVGKNTFVEPLGILLGQHYVLLSSIEELVSNFNYHLKHAVLIHANEALWGGNKKQIGTIKAMITEQRCLIEGKGKDRIMVKNFKHLIISSNEDWPVHIDADDRRFLVLQVSEKRKEDHAYFKLIQEELDGGGYEGLLYDLLNEDVSNFNPRQLPHSNQSFAIKLRSADSDTRYIYEALKEGSFNLTETGPIIWQSSIPSADLFRLYQEWCNQNGETAKNKNHFFTTLCKRIHSAKNWRPSIDGNRTYAYKFLNLDQTRKDFAKAFKADPSYLFEKQNEEYK